MLGWNNIQKFIGDLSQLIAYRNKIYPGRETVTNIYGDDLPSIINFLKSKLSVS